jgi:glutathione S-transferase
MALNDVYTVYGDSRSGNCYKAALILSLTGRRYAWREIDVMSGETRSPEFLRMNPNGKVPVLRLTDGRYLAESNAMLLHLAEGTAFLPEDSYRRAVVYQWLFFEQYSHEPCIAVARFIVRFAGREAQEAERLGQLRAKGREALAVMENSLAASDFIAGDDFSIADIALYAYTHVAEEGGFDMNAFPRIMGWLGRVESFPGFRCMQDACR